MKNTVYQSYLDFKCDVCGHVHSKIKTKATNNRFYLQCKECEHCRFVDTINDLKEEKIVEAVNRSNNYDFCETKEPFIPLAISGNRVSGLGVVAHNYPQWQKAIVNQARNPLTGKSTSKTNVPSFGEENDYIDFNQLMKTLSKFYGLQDHREINTVNFTEFKKHRDSLIKERLPELALIEFENKPFSEYSKEDHHIHGKIIEIESEIIRTTDFNQKDYDFWISLFRFNKRIQNGYKGTLVDFFNLSKWSEPFWAYILLIDTLTKDHPARDKDNIRFYFHW